MQAAPSVVVWHPAVAGGSVGVVFDRLAGLVVGEELGRGLVVRSDHGEAVGVCPFDSALGIADADETGLAFALVGDEVAEEEAWSGGGPLGVAGAEEDVVIAGRVVSDDGGHEE